MEVTCPNCEELVPERRLNTQTMVAVCPNCGEVFDFSKMVRVKPRTQRLIKPPENLDVKEKNGATIISFSWFGWRAPIFLSSGILIMATPLGLLNILGGEGQTVSYGVLALFASIAFFGIMMTYYSLAQFMNTTRIIIEDDRFRVLHTPIPMPGNIRTARDNIAQIHRLERKRETVYGEATAYDIKIELKDGSEHMVIGNLSDEEHARYLDYQIRRSLND